MVAAAAAGTGGDPPLPLGPAQAAVAAMALPVTLFGHGTDSHGSPVDYQVNQPVIVESLTQLHNMLSIQIRGAK